MGSKLNLHLIDRDWETLKLPPHLFVTVVGADAVLVDDEHCHAVYMEGIKAIYVAGGSDNSDLGEIARSVIHECVHYLQEIEGRLTGSKENEEEAENLAQLIAKAHESVMWEQLQVTRLNDITYIPNRRCNESV